jgi:site-specific recombinase XerD
MIDHFLTHLQDEDLSPGTLNTYRANLRLFGQWLTDNGLTVSTLTQANLRDYKNNLKERYKPATINIKLTCVSLLLQWAVKSGHIPSNPMTRIKLVKPEDACPKWLTQGQVEAIQQATQEAIQQARAKQLEPSLKIALRQSAIVVILLNTGLRVSELCDLKLGDVQNGILTVKWGKGGKRREVPMNDQARAALKAWLDVRRSKSEYLFETTKRMGRQLVQWHMAELGKRLGFRLTPHLLRHTFGKRLADKGIPLDRIAKLMGHSDINTTAIYTMPSMEDLRQAVKLLD